MTAELTCSSQCKTGESLSPLQECVLSCNLITGVGKRVFRNYKVRHYPLCLKESS